MDATMRDEVARLSGEVQRLTARVDQLERRHSGMSWRHRLGWLLGNRLTSLVHHGPVPLHVPAHYATHPLPDAPPTIALVTPSYQQATFLRQTLDSVLSQGYPRLEYVVQDGGSTDGSVALLEQYERHLQHAESVPDDGQADAINRGFGHTTGEVMAYLNSDDLLLPGSLAFVASYFAVNPDVDVVYGHRAIIDACGDEVGRWVLPPHCPQMLQWADFVPQETLFWRRRIWDRVGGRMDESFQFALDWDLLLRFHEVGAKMVRLPRFLGAFRVHDAQKTSARLATVGQAEMARLRQRVHGREVTPAEVRRAITPYILRHMLYHWLYRMGLLWA